MKKRSGKGVGISVGILLVAALIYLTHDIIITNYLAYRICLSDPQPKTFIKKTVEYPESIYWEDNIYRGFDEKDRLLMIRNYLDGVHLKTMGLNGPDGKIYVYTATAEDWQESSSIDKKSQEDWKKYFATLAAESRAIAARGRVMSHGNLPFFQYSVVFNPVPLTSFERRYLWSDEVIITENSTEEVIAFNRRLMRRWYRIEPEPVGGCLSMTELYSVPFAGKALIYNLDDHVFFQKKNKNNILRNFKCKRALRSRL